MFNWLRPKPLSSALGATRTLHIQGVKFVIQKISVSHFIEGGKVMKQTVDTYKTKGEIANAASNVKWDDIQSHYADVFMAGVVRPKLSRKPEAGAVCVDEMFRDWGICNELYEAIGLLTYGKKKHQLKGSREPSL